MELITEKERAEMLANGRENKRREKPLDHFPVVRLFAPWSDDIWLLTELDPDDPEWAYGLHDNGRELVIGPVELAAVANLTGREGLRVMRDAGFKAFRRLSTYAYFARVIPRDRKGG